jgi:hypothetical protein
MDDKIAAAETNAAMVNWRAQENATLEDQREQLRREELDAALSGWRAQENALVEDQKADNDALWTSGQPPLNATNDGFRIMVQDSTPNVPDQFLEDAEWMLGTGNSYLVSMAAPYANRQNDRVHAALFQLASTAFHFGHARSQGYRVAGALLIHYLLATGNAVYVPANYLLDDPQNGNSLLIASTHAQISTLLDGPSIQFPLVGSGFSIRGAWNPVGFRFTGALNPAFGSATLRPLSGADVSVLEYDPNTQMLTISISQQIEVHDRYDWGANGYAVSFDETTDTVLIRLPNANGYGGYIMPNTNDANPPYLQYNPADPSGTAQLVSELAPNGFRVIEFPPDGIDVGALSASISGTGTGTGFGTPDHPNYLATIGTAISAANNMILAPQFVIQPMNYPSVNYAPNNLYTGDFHGMESSGQASAFVVVSSYTQITTYILPVTLSGSGYIIDYSRGIPVPTASAVPNISVSQNQVIQTVAEAGYSPAQPLEASNENNPNLSH